MRTGSSPVVCLEEGIYTDAAIRHSFGVNKWVWQRLPARVRGLKPVRSYGVWLHKLVCRRSDREMYLGTSFLRNRPALELMRRIVNNADEDARIRIAVLGCSIGVEVYSILWTLRSCRPDLDLAVQAVDISPEVVGIAQRGIYGPPLRRRWSSGRSSKA